MEGKLFCRKYLIWVVLLLGQQLQGCLSCIEKESNALFDLKKHILSITKGGYEDFTLQTWFDGSTIDCCQWETVKCSGTSGRVTEFSITAYFKNNSVLNLSFLHPFEEVQSLHLNGFEATGLSGLYDDVDGYKSLRRLKKLEILDFSKHYFNNSIFPFLNSATSLKTLVLRDNIMESPLLELKDLTNLELLDLSGNRFNGSIPVQELSALRKLKALDLHDNEFSGSMELQGICKLKNIQELDLSQNKLVGTVPLCLTSLSGLRLLELSSNQLTGNVPSAIGSLESLEYLSLIDNRFEGLFSFGLLTNLSKLKVFKLGSTSNSLQVYSESSWKPRFQLRGITLKSCNLEKVPHFLRQQRELRHVDLYDNNISGIFPSLGNNFLTGFQLPKSAHNLRSLDVSINKFDHLLPEDIGWILPHLHSMNISKNSFQGNLPSSLSNMKDLEFLDVSHNSFHGELPRNFLKSSTYLRTLKLSHNNLSGEIFPEPANFGEIYVLSMDNNRFTKIGQGLRSFTTLQMLDISNNSLTGVISSWINELKALNLSHNNLSGVIPKSFSGLKNVESLHLSFNRLHGRIPIQLTDLTSLARFNVSYNNLSGVIPQGRQFNTFGKESYLGNPLLCGEPTRLSCEINNIQKPDTQVEADESLIDLVIFLLELCCFLSDHTSWNIRISLI